MSPARRTTFTSETAIQYMTEQSVCNCTRSWSPFACTTCPDNSCSSRINSTPSLSRNWNTSVMVDGPHFQWLLVFQLRLNAVVLSIVLPRHSVGRMSLYRRPAPGLARLSAVLAQFSTLPRDSARQRLAYAGALLQGW